MDKTKVTNNTVNSTLRGIINYTDAVGNKHVLEVPVTFIKSINNMTNANEALEPMTSFLRRNNCVINSCSIFDTLENVNGGAQVVVRENDSLDSLGRYKAFSKQNGKNNRKKIVVSKESDSRLEALQALTALIGDFDFIHDLANIIITNDGSLTKSDIRKWF